MLEILYQRFLGHVRPGRTERRAVVAKDVAERMHEEAEKHRFPCHPIDIAPINVFMGIEIIAHPKMPPGEFMFLPDGMEPDLAVELLLEKKRGEADANADSQ